MCIKSYYHKLERPVYYSLQNGPGVTLSDAGVVNFNEVASSVSYD